MVDVVALAQSQQGKRYGRGAIDATLQQAMYDCSSLVASVYAAAGFTLPLTSQTQAAYVTPTDNPQPGDLVFGSFQGPNSHVGIYAGNGQVVSALDEAEGIKTTPVWRGATFGHVPGFANGPASSGQPSGNASSTGATPQRLAIGQAGGCGPLAVAGVALVCAALGTLLTYCT